MHDGRGIKQENKEKYGIDVVCVKDKVKTY
jgi:hypothetical protein